ncbi:Protein ALWAYS EARLY 3 [Datura stramonium]|uniref:Protein ALWAYS EARLY 3 n=1 Tax=Datura stramonium TaxID=4076 RepID=A0ABS8RGZ3_DATST|nr:Protein ALWAYS EARLY 3 [Datura stramonium]
MNDDVLENQKSGDCSLKDSEPFKKQYAAVLIQLNEVNEQVSSALYRLRQRNTYQAIPLHGQGQLQILLILVCWSTLIIG